MGPLTLPATFGRSDSRSSAGQGRGRRVMRVSRVVDYPRHRQRSEAGA